MAAVTSSRRVAAINSLKAAVTCDRQAACTHVRVMYTPWIGPAAAICGRQVIFTMGRLAAQAAPM